MFDEDIIPYKRIAAAVLEQALRDYKIEIPLARKSNKKEKTGKQKQEANRKSALKEIIKNYIDSYKWFEDKSRKPFGYYWCLEIAEISPIKVSRYRKRVDEENNPLLKGLSESGNL